MVSFYYTREEPLCDKYKSKLVEALSNAYCVTATISVERKSINTIKKA